MKEGRLYNIVLKIVSTKLLSVEVKTATKYYYDKLKKELMLNL